MSVLAQHGYGKGDKIERALSAGDASGVILSPRDESPENMATFVRRLRADYQRAVLFFDPQFYVSTITAARSGRLPEYDYFRGELQYRDFIEPSAVSKRVHATLRYQADLDVTHFCAPTVAIDSFGDRWSSVALSMAAEAIRYHARLRDPRPLLVSLVFSDAACRSSESVEEFLDLLTDLECHGFYIILKRDAAASILHQNIEPTVLGSLQYFAHVLSTLNDYETYFGYSDLLALPLHAAGATASACGWQLGLRRFTFARFEPASGGRQPRQRYTSLPLLNCVFVNPELDAIQSAGKLDEVLTGTSFDDRFRTRRPSSTAWPNDLSALHHWASLRQGVDAIARHGQTIDRIRQLERLIDTAERLYSTLHRSVPFETTASHLAEWRNGVRDFAQRADLA